MQFAKVKLLARALDRAALYEEGRVVVSYLLRSDFGEVGAVEPYSEGIIDVLRAVEGAELAALIREPPRDGSPARKISLRSSTDRVDVSAIARQVGRRRPPAGGRVLERPPDRGDHRLHRRRVRGPPCRARLSGAPATMAIPKALEPTGVILVDKPAGPSSFAVLAGVRSRTGAKTGHAGTLDPFATGLLILLSGRATTMASCFVGLPKRYLTDVDLSRRTTTGDPEGEPLERHEPPTAEAARVRARGPPRRDRASDPDGVGRQDRG